MTTFEKNQKGTELLNTLFAKSWEDNAFKMQLIDNPIATIEGITGRNFMMPENKKLVVEDQTDESVVYLNIPAQPNLDELELSDEQLEHVSGGFTPLIALEVVAGVIAVGEFGYGVYQGWNSVK